MFEPPSIGRNRGSNNSGRNNSAPNPFSFSLDSGSIGGKTSENKENVDRRHIIHQKMDIILSRYQQTNLLCAFNYWTYNRFPMAEVEQKTNEAFKVYGRMIPQDKHYEVFSEVVRRNPNRNECVPVLIRTADQLLKRVQVQDERIIQMRTIIDSCGRQLHGLCLGHEDVIRRRLERILQKKKELESTLVRIQQRASLQQKRGLQFSQDDINLLKRICEIEGVLEGQGGNSKNMSLRNKMAEIFPKIQKICENNGHQTPKEVKSVGMSEEMKKKVGAFLQIQNDGIQKLTEVLKEKMKDVQTMKESLDRHVNVSPF